MRLGIASWSAVVAAGLLITGWVVAVIMAALIHEDVREVNRKAAMLEQSVNRAVELAAKGLPYD